MRCNVQLFSLSLLIFLFIQCNNPEESDKIPPSISILSPQDGSTVSEVVEINCSATDNDKVKKVELWVDGVSTEVIDNSIPYSLEWNTASYQNNSSHIIMVKAYDMSNNTADSDQITLIVDNSNSRPSGAAINSILFHNNSFKIKWLKNEESDFYSYTLHRSVNSDMSNKHEIFMTTNINDTAYVVTGIALDGYSYFDLKVTDIYGFSSLSSIYTGSSFLKVAYNSDHESKEDICIVDINGKAKANLTQDSYWSYDPVFSHDGSKIAYQASIEEQLEIFIMDADGSNKTRLTNNPDTDNFPQFSPDDSQIAFCSFQNGYSQIFIMNSDGSNKINLSNNTVDELHPQFSPDGSKIIFVSNRDGNEEIYMMNIDGSSQINLTDNMSYDTSPQFSSDGSKIIFLSLRTWTFTLYSMNINGSNQSRLSSLPGEIKNYDISPDGSKVTYQYFGPSSVDIYIMDINGNNPNNLTNNQGWEPNFSPDGSKIVFSTTRNENNGEIYLMNSDGSDQVNLTNDIYGNRSPRFQPR